MNDQLFTISQWITMAFSVAFLILACTFRFRGYLPAYLKTFPIYCLVSVTADLAAAAAPSRAGLIYLAFSLFELAYFCYLIGNILRNRIAKKVLVILASIFLAFIATLIFRTKNCPYGLPEASELLVLFGPTLVCYREIVLDSHSYDLFRDAAFWMVSGILLYLVFLVPTLLAAEYFFAVGKIRIGKICFSFNNAILIISYLFYTKAFLCSKPV